MGRSKTDAELIEEFKAGSDASFEELIQRYSPKAFSLATRLTRSQEDAEEVLQDVFVTVYRKINSFEGKSSFSSWLYRITVNASFMKLRRRRRDTNVSLEDIVPQLRESLARRDREPAESDDILMRRQLISALEFAISKLPEEYRPVFVLRDVDGLTSREVGKILNLSIPAVKSRLHRSRSMVRRRLGSLLREWRAGQKRLPEAGNL
jgi:RNA polymerase sigma-70 factor (ECF subfamily)